VSEKKFIVKIEYDAYNSGDEKDGKTFISVSGEDSTEGKNSYGFGSPCDSKEEAIESILHFLKKDAYGNPRPEVKMKDIELTNTTDMTDITIPFLVAKLKGVTQTNLFGKPATRQERKQAS
jgi:hypothetical protein